MVAASGSAIVSPGTTTIYTLIAKNQVGQVSKTVTVTVTSPPAPTITSFTATPTTITRGNSATLTWNTQNAAQVVLSSDGSIASSLVGSNGSLTVVPVATTTYTLRATNPSGEDTKSVTVVVNPCFPGQCLAR